VRLVDGSEALAMEAPQSDKSNGGSANVSVNTSGSIRKEKELNKSCVELIEAKLAKKEVFWSFEYFPPKTETGMSGVSSFIFGSRWELSTI
jgi:hypothetical protein